MRTAIIVRLLAAGVAFAVVAYLGIGVLGNFSTDAAAASWALIAAIGLLVAFAAYAAVEWLQTRRLDSIGRQFDTRTIVLMPLAIALNIVLGAAVGNALKVPVYLDSIGTILVGVLAGPIPGALTGLLSNLLWTYVMPPPFQNGPAAAFAIVAAVIGLLAGLFGRLGFVRPRPDRPLPQLLAAGSVAVALVGLLALYAYTRFYTSAFQLFSGNPHLHPVFAILGWLVVVLGALAVLGLFALLVVRRDLTVAHVTVAGVATGVIAALISAPISANLFGGVTGAGTDFVVAAFRQAGSDIQAATFQQGLLSDPVDKLLTFFIVYLIVQAMSRRLVARFPQGERVVARDDDSLIVEAVG
ncbi:MAG: hypothetical protein M3295_08505 [Chloroflexota bacterium]|nr:hypothetical protein [Chloroflexota bacterium]